MIKKIISCLLSVLILFSIVSIKPVATVYAQEGDGNLGFESNLDGWNVTGTVTNQATGGKNGNYALMKSGSSLKKTIKGIPQGSYTVSMWVKGATSSNSANVTIKDTGGPDSVLKIDTYLDSSTWREIAHRNVLVYNGQMTINVNAGTSSGLQIDDVTITLDSNDNNPVQNWDFESGLQNWVTKGQVNIDTANADTGVNAVKLATDSEVSQKVSVKPNTDYIATVRMKVDKQDTYKTTKQYNVSNTNVIGVLVDRLTLGNRVNLGVRGLDGVVLRQAPASTEGYALVTIAFHTGVNQSEVELYANTIFDQSYVKSVSVHENKDTDNPYPNGWQRPNYKEIDSTHPADEWTSNGNQFAYVDNLNVFEISNEYIKGTDMTFLQSIEDAGGKYFANGVQQDALRILSNHGVNSILTTLWVKSGNPVYDWSTLTPLSTETKGYDGETVTGRQTLPGYFDKKHSVAIGKRANELNMTYTPSFHYSDTWISAAKAHMPYEWIQKDYNGNLSNPDIQMLETAVYNYVHDTLSEMKSEGVKVISVKNGNEQDGGLLFPVAMGSNYNQHAAIITASTRAVKEIYPGAIDTIHTNTGYDPAQITDFFQAFANRGAEFDGMAFSLYGGRETTNQFVMMNAAMQNNATKYYDYINVETGFTFTTSSPIGDTESTLTMPQYYNATPNGQYNFLLDYMQAPLDIPNPYGTKRGFYYWNTEAIAIYGAGAKAGEGPGGSKRTMFNNGTDSIKEMGSTLSGKSGDMMDSMYAYLIRGNTKKASDTLYNPLRYNGTNYEVGEATSLSFLNANLSLKVGKVSRLQPTIAPMDKLLKDYTIHYTSNNPNVAEVSDAGFVTGRSAGTAVITASIGNITTTVSVTVNGADSTSGMTITYDIIRGGGSVGTGTITQGSTINAKPYDKIKFKSAVLGNPTKKAVVYTVSDPNIAWWYGDTWQTDDRTMRTLSDKLSTANYEPVVQLNPVKGGTATITAASDDGAISVSFNVTVTQTDVTQVSISGGDRSVLAGKSLQLTASVTPNDASFYKVYWSSADESIAKVDSKGFVTAIKPGTTTIKIISDSNPAITASITLTVTDVLVEKILLSNSKIGLPVGGTKALVYLAQPDNAVNKAVIWSVKPGSEGIISIDQHGVVTGLQAGTGTVVVTSTDGSHVTAECIVKVVEGSIAATSMELSKNEVWFKSNYFSSDSAVKGDNKPVNKLDAIFMPEEATNTGVIWSSNNDAVASVDANGIITAHKTGVAVITATSIDGGFTDNATIYVPQISEDWENYDVNSKGGFTDGNTFTYQVVDASGNKKLQAAVLSQKGSATSLNRRTFTPVSDDKVVVDFDWNVGSFTADNRYRGGHISLEDTNGNTYLALATYPAAFGTYPEMTYYFNKTYNSTAMPTKNGTVNGDYNYIHGGFTGTSGAVGSYTDTKDVGIGFKGANKDYNVRVNLDFKNRKISFTVTDKSDPSITATVTDLAMDSRISYSNSFGAIAFSHYFNSVASWTTKIDNLAVYTTTIKPEKIDFDVKAINVNASQGIKLVPVKNALSATAKINASVIPAAADQRMLFTPLGDLAGSVSVDTYGNVTINPTSMVNYGNYEAIQNASGYIRVSSVSAPDVYTDVKLTVGSPNASEILQVYVDGEEYSGPLTLEADATPKLTYVASGGDGVSDVYDYNWQVTSGNAQIDANGVLSAQTAGKVAVTFTIDLFRKQEVRTLEFNFINMEEQQVFATPDSGTFATPIHVALSTETGNSIYFTTDGSEPSVTSIVYSTPVFVDKTMTIKAVAAVDGVLIGKVAEFNYTIVQTIPTYTVTYDRNGGTGTPPVGTSKVEGEAFAAAEVDGITAPEGKRFKEWNTASDGKGRSYAESATITMPAEDLTLYAIWVDEQYTVDIIASPASGTYTSPILVTLSTRTGGSESSVSSAVYFTTDGSEPSVTSAVYGTSQFVDRNMTIKAVAIVDGVLISQVAEFNYIIVENVPTYHVTYDGNGATAGNVPTDEIAYEEGDTIIVKAGNLQRSGYKFVGWTKAAEGTGTVYGADSTFTIGAGHITFYAKWEYIAENSNGNNGQGNTIPTPMSPQVDMREEGGIAIITGTLTGNVDAVTKSFNAIVKADLIAALTERAQKEEALGRKNVIEFNMTTNEDTSTIGVEFPRESFKQLADTTETDISINTGNVNIIFNAKTINFLSDSIATGNITIGIKEVDKASLTASVQEKIGDRPIYDFKVKIGNAEISQFSGGNVEVHMPYKLQPNENKNSIVVYYMDGLGKLNTVKGKYDEDTGTVKFTTPHFSTFAVGYNDVSFDDVKNDAWYDEAVSFMAARGFVNGVGNNKFNPSGNVTRADYLIMVMNSFGIEIDTQIKDNFVDAGNKKYYTAYLATAKRLGLVAGLGNNVYAPEADISRQDMMVVLYNILEKLGELPTGNSGIALEKFGDASQISSYAVEAIKLFTETGITVGDGENLNPRATTTREQAVQIVYNLLSAW